MAVNPNLFIHEADKAALNALKAVPGFSTVLKAFMNVWNEKQFKIRNMSTNLRISEEQLPKYYNMLPPICEKLGIDVPELYLELDVRPNAYTSGDTNPFIVITSGLIETMPEELIPTVIAHECGHIACRHVLYRTMGKIILSGAISALGIPGIATLPIQAAFAYWMRCSEYSADRAAVICDGGASKMAEVCARYAGFGKHIEDDLNMEAFLNQAIEYNEMMNEDQWNKTLELLMYSYNTHPLNAVRAYECLQWEKSEQYIKVKDYLEKYKNNEIMDELPIEWSERTFIGKDYREVEQEIRNYGFSNIELYRVIEKPGLFTRENQTLRVSVNNTTLYDEGDWVSVESKIVIAYYAPLTEEEIIKMHPGETRVPNSSRYYARKYVDDVIKELYGAGFTTIKIKEVANGDPRLSETVSMVSINGKASFSRGEWFDVNSEVVIFVKKNVSL